MVRITPACPPDPARRPAARGCDLPRGRPGGGVGRSGPLLPDAPKSLAAADLRPVAPNSGVLTAQRGHLSQTRTGPSSGKRSGSGCRRSEWASQHDRPQPRQWWRQVQTPNFSAQMKHSPASSKRSVGGASVLVICADPSSRRERGVVRLGAWGRPAARVPAAALRATWRPPLRRDSESDSVARSHVSGCQLQLGHGRSLRTEGVMQGAGPGVKEGCGTTQRSGLRSIYGYITRYLAIGS